MIATASDVVQVAAPPAGPAAPAPAHSVDSTGEAAQRRAETTLVRTALFGAGVGAVVCAAIWVGLVAIATAGNGNALAPLLAMAAGCGVFAGLFLGGCAGALAGSRALERVEHERMHAARHEPTSR